MKLSHMKDVTNTTELTNSYRIEKGLSENICKNNEMFQEWRIILEQYMCLIL